MFFKPVKLDYDFSKILQADHNAHTCSCSMYQVVEMPDIYEPVGGYPKSFCLENTTIHQLWWDETQLDFKELGRQLDMEVVSVSSIRQDPGNVVPYHRDTFFKIKSKYPERNNELKVRANMCLEKGKIGHVIAATVNGEDRYFYNWEANTGCMFDSEILHVGMNGGLEPKYTLQISGFYTGQI